MATAEDSRDERVLVLMPEASDAESARRLLAKAGMACYLCADVESLCRELIAGAGVVTLTEEALAGDGSDRLLAALGSQPVWSDVPLVVLSGVGSAARHAIFSESTNTTWLEQSGRDETLQSAVRSALRARRHQYQMRGLLAASARAEEGRRDAEARYLELFNAIEHGFCTLEVAFDENLRPVDYRFLEVSPSFEAQTGIVDAAGRWMREIAPGQDQHWFDLYGRVALTGEPCRFEQNSTPLDRWWSVFAFRTGDPSLRRVAVLFHDITGRKRAEEALRESEARFRLMADALPQIVWITDPEGRMQFLNQQWSAYTGMAMPATSDDIAGAVIHPDDRPGTKAAFDAALQTGGTLAVEHRLRSAAGEYRWFLVRGEPYRDPRTQQIAGWFGASVDIHDRRRAEEALRASEERQTYLVRLADSLRPLSDPNEIQAAANHVLGEYLGANRVLYFEITGQDYVVERDYADGVGSLAGRYPTASFGAALLESFRAGRTVVEADATTKPDRSADERAAFQAIRVRGHVDVPLVKAGELVAGMTVHLATERRWTAEEVALIEQTAERTWAAVERARAERALRAGEERFRTLFESMNEGYCVVEPIFDGAGRPVDYRYLLTNPSLEHHTGLRDIDGKTAREVLPSVEARRIDLFARVAVTGEPIRLTDHVPALGRWYDISAFPVGGGQVGVLFADVTARRGAEEELRASEARLAEIFRHAPSFMAVLSGSGHVFERVNDRYLELIGGRDVVGLPIREALPEIDGQGYFEMLDRVYRTGEPFVGSDHPVLIARRGRLETRVLDFVYQPIRDAGGAVTGVLVQGIDTTERKRAEEALRERDERLQLAVGIARMGTFEIDLSTDAVSVNEPGKDIYGWPDTSTTFEQVQTHFHPDDKEEVMRQVGAALDPAGPGVFEVEQRIIRTDGVVRWLRVRGRAMFDGEARNAVLLVGAYLDVTEQKEAEEELRAADRKKDDFIALLAHELRNPLAPIRNGLQVLRLAGADEEAVRETREIMERQISHMVRLIDDLLDISRINRNKMELRLSKLTLAEAVKGAVETARPTIDAGGHELVVDIPDRPIYLEADLTRLAQVFSNLLTNSAKYTRHGGNVRLTAVRQGDIVAVSVSDNGIGIPPESLANIFDMFSQVDRSVERSTGGLGIGLALVKGLVEMHGGRVAAASEGEGRGSTFTVTLPVVATGAAPSPTLKANGKLEVRRRILVVDDSQDGANTLARMLRLMGNDVRTANDGLEGVEAAREFRPEVVLMDVGMPILNGLDATRQIREQEWGRDIRIIALTGWGQEGDRDRSREAGCDGHLVKPVDIDELEKLLDFKGE